MADEFWLTDDQMDRLRPLLPDKVRGVPRVDDRRVISGIVHVLRSGCRWRDAPECYGPRKTLYNRFRRWADKGVWRHVFEELAAAGGPTAELMIDATYAKAHRSAAGGKGGRTTRRSVPRAGGAPASSTSCATRPGDRGRSRSPQATTATVSLRCP